MSRFNRAVILTLGVLAFLTALLVWRGNRAATNTGPTRILYLAQDEQERYQLFVVALEGGAPDQLTKEPFGIWEYSVSADGKMIAYSALRVDGKSDLWAMGSNGKGRRQLLACPEADCAEIDWAPDSRRLVYTRRDNALAPPHLWWLAIVNGNTAPLFQDDQKLGFAASYSPDGQWISYVSPGDPGVRVYNLNDGHSILIPVQTDAPAVWSPQGDALLVTNVQWQGIFFSVNLLRANPENGQLINLSGAAGMEDGPAVWSPDGSWIAFGRNTPRIGAGKQIGMMRPYGSEVRFLTNDDQFHHGLQSWSPNGCCLLFQRYPLTDPDAQPGIWLLEIETGTFQEVVTPGSWPVWLP